MSGGMDGLDRARYHRVLSPVAFISFLLVINFPGNFRGPPFFFFLCWWVLEYLGISFFPLSNPAEVALLVGEISVFMSHSIIHQSYLARYRRSRSLVSLRCAARPDIVKDPWVQLLPAFPTLSSPITSFSFLSHSLIFSLDYLCSDLLLLLLLPPPISSCSITFHLTLTSHAISGLSITPPHRSRP
ncbi:uncharacterized protein AKAW2_51409A [Aspergillus luchuensis]|uniref:Uncharacterized protein n=1 Tax=Aspergillus kawachii TaxID=1069201 RepID=A0A7R7WDP0_ASPKA|nr:uncharacterized protein AKAW2_51409A [Aspergillus luchuensis]BCS01068.1 hypothetical protein AKAW2_51409A [Aspergillus luchuensis]